MTSRSDWETVCARDVVVGDIIQYRNCVYEVENNRTHHMSPYAKMNLILLDETSLERTTKISLYVKFGLAHLFSRCVKERIMSTNLIVANEQAGVIREKLSQISIISEIEADKLGNITFTAIGTINKETLLGVAKQELRVAMNRLAEVVKKL